MTFVSYAQNFEDVMLWRALKHVQNGFYVDVGAQDPLVDSVSLAFYEHGWRGIHIEPIPHYAEKLRQQRPDETVIQAAIGATAGTITFFEIADTGLSTGVAEIAKRHREQGLAVRETAVPCLTLTQALEPYLHRQIHWMKIDTEGFERQVIQGWEGEKIRPWVLVIESTAPSTTEENYGNWEFMVLERGYEFVYFDGLNRYYVSTSHRELLERFDGPPNLFDDFTLSGTQSAPFTTLLNARLAARDGQLVQVQQQLAARDTDLAQTQQQLATRNAELSQIQQHLATRDAELSQTQQHLATRDAELAQTQQQLAARNADIEMICRSLSWRLTKPLRLANRARHSMFASLRRVLRRSIALVRSAPRDLLRHAGVWALNRPRLAAVGRKVLARFPRLRSFFRQKIVVVPSLPPTPTVPLPQSAQGFDLSEDAAHVLRHLQRAINR
jgi:FkbM family methyltransferase